MRVSDKASGLFFAFVGLAIVVAGWGYRSSGGGPTSPALFPMIVGGVICLSGIAVALASRGHDVALPAARLSTHDMFSLAVVPASIIFYAVAAPVLGSIAASFVTVFVPAVVWKAHYVTALIVAAVASTVLHVVFALGLRIPLPVGPIERLLF